MHRRTVPASTLETSQHNTDVKKRRKRRRVKRSRYSEYFQSALMVVGFVVLLYGLVEACLSLFNRFVGGDEDQESHREANRHDHHHSTHHGGGLHQDTRLERLEELPFNSIYRVPNSMAKVGDRSDAYVTLRKETDALLTPVMMDDHWGAIQDNQAAYQTRLLDVHNSDQVVPYDIHNCPEEPPEGYPYMWKTVDILKAWPSDQTTAPTNGRHHLIHQSVCVFDYETDLKKAFNYRQALVPFLIVNDPAVQQAAVRWSMPGYMQKLMGEVLHRAEVSNTNHFMYWIPPPRHKRQLGGGRNSRLSRPEGWTEPTKNIRMTYADWLNHANVTRDIEPDEKHWYFRLIGCGGMGNEGNCDAGSSEYLFDELTFFQPKPSIYIADPNEQKGIHCRFGMQGCIAENHFDGSRNSIVVLKGQRRYILSHPSQCGNLALYPKGHPSARHSAVDWSNPDMDEFPEFASAESTELVLQAGQVLYLPTNWFHFIVSLGLNFQCNTRSGIETELFEHVKKCGF